MISIFPTVLVSRVLIMVLVSTILEALIVCVLQVSQVCNVESISMIVRMHHALGLQFALTEQTILTVCAHLLLLENFVTLKSISVMLPLV